MKFRKGDRVIDNKGNRFVILGGQLSIFGDLKVINESGSYYKNLEQLEIDVQYYREEKLKKLLGYE